MVSSADERIGMVFVFQDLDFAPAKNFVEKKSRRLPLNFSLAEASENSPQFQLRVCIPNQIKPRRGERNSTGNFPARFSAVPPGLISFCPLNPRLKPWAIFFRRSATLI
jgi:hypothetical protein